MPLIIVSTPTPHEPFEVRVQGGEAPYAVVCNAAVTQWVYVEPDWYVNTSG